MGEILNEDELQQRSADRHMTANGANLCTGEAIAEQFDDERTSAARRGAQIVHVPETPLAVSITTTPTKSVAFSAVSIDDLIVQADLANNRLLVKDPCYIEVFARVSGDWGSNEELYIDVYINGAIASPFPLRAPDKGAQAGGPSSTGLGPRIVAITQADVDAGPDGASIEIFLSGDGSFALDVRAISLAALYVPYTVRTTG